MKFYETHFEDYLNANEKYNIHPELDPLYEKLPNNINDCGNLIIYGPACVGKYTQVLKIIKKYSNSQLKYDKKIKIQSEKQAYVYRMSDIHYEIDMSLLGCNSKILWNDIFLQIVDIVSMKQEKKGFIVCKNFNYIHTELLEIFYSYIQQYNHEHTNIQIRFIIMTEHISFIPNNILNCCKIISIKRPLKEHYLMMSNNINEEDNTQTDKKIKIKEIMSNIDEIENIKNIKEIYSFHLLENKDNIPNDLFSIICDNIIKEIENHQKIVFSNFRDTIYDILIYNLDVSECLWYILNYFIKNNRLKEKSITEIIKKTHMFLKYYNNNYRPIYHLENIFYFIINQMNDYTI